MHSAVRLMSLYGYDKVSIAMIARDVGIQGSSIYNHYKSKDMILEDIIRHIRDMFYIPRVEREEVKQWLRTSSPQEILNRHCYQSLDNRHYEIMLSRIFFREIFTLPKIPYIIWDIWSEYRTFLLELLECLVDLQAIPSTDVETLSQVWVRTRFVFSMLYAHDEYTYISQYKNLTDMFIKIATGGLHIPETNLDSLPVPEKRKNDRTPPTNTKEKILHAAFDLCCDNGFDKTTVLQIAEKVGISASAIYNHYENKEEIRRSMFRQMKDGHEHSYQSYREIFDRFRKMGDVSTLICDLANSYLYTTQDAQIKNYRLLFHEQFQNSEMKYYYIGLINEDRIFLTDAIRALVQDGLIPDCDYYSIATAYIFTQCTVNIENAFFHKKIEDTQNFRTRAAAIFAGVLVYGLPGSKEE